jgi:radical SAM superfamily enzyme YgiQ (UPF0313 family)
MADIVLATLNARYVHCSFGLRYLLANMGELEDATTLLEFTIQQPTLEVLDSILAQSPRIVGFGVYIWNVDETTRLVADLKRVRPEIIVVLGGPEVSYEPDGQEIVRLADHVIAGEADLAFAAFCREELSRLDRCENAVHRDHHWPIDQGKLIPAPLPVMTSVALPYGHYSDDDIAHRVIYVEASRGCPFTCEFCLSALDIPVRQFPLDQFLVAMEGLLQRGARQFKFVDRTFNLNLRVGRSILEFFLERYTPGLFLHFEMIPDRLPDALRELILRFPPGALQFEVGIQTFNEEVCELISRRQENELVEQNLKWLRNSTGVHVHADLIVGLPGESVESFGAGFNRLVRLEPHEIQVGILKRLRGTPIVRHDDEWSMVYSPHPPYEVLSTKLLDFSTLQELRRFAKYWDAIANSGNFVETVVLVWTDIGREQPVEGSPFHEFRRLVSWLFGQERKTHGIPLSRLVELMFKYLIDIKGIDSNEVAATLWRDYQRGGRNDKPHCLRPFIESATAGTRSPAPRDTVGPKRQARHWQA